MAHRMLCSIDKHRYIIRFAIIFFSCFSTLLKAKPWIEFCQSAAVLNAYQSIKDSISQQPVVQGYPWEIKLRTSILTPESNTLAKYPYPSVHFWRTNGSGVVFPLFKIEPWVERIFQFGHGKLDKDGFEFYPRGSPKQEFSALYPHGLPNPMLMDYYQIAVLSNLFASYHNQNLPPMVWQSILQDEFALSNHRSFEIVITYQHELRAYARIYIGSKELQVEREVFGKAAPPAKVFTMGTESSVAASYETPAERLLKRFGIKDNPIEELRQRFSNHMLVELGRLHVLPDAQPEGRQKAKSLLMNALVSVLVKMAPDGDLSKLLLVASSGPFGNRTYPREFGATEIYKTSLKAENFVADRGDANAVGGDFILNFFWVPDLAPIKSTFEEGGESSKDLTFFAVPGDVFRMQLIQKGTIINNFPNLDQFPFLSYNSKLDQPLNGD